jgi:hypothetical protein
MLMNSNNELEHYHYMWDGIEYWALVNGVIPSTTLTIVFDGDVPSAYEIVALRKAVAQFRDKSLKEIKVQLGYSKSIDVGNFTAYEVHFLVPQIQEQHLAVKLTDQSYTGHIPYHPATGNILIGLALENRALFLQIVQKLLLKGVPVFDIAFEID